MIRFCIECGDDLDEDTIYRVCWTCARRLQAEENAPRDLWPSEDASDG